MIRFRGKASWRIPIKYTLIQAVRPLECAVITRSWEHKGEPM